MRTTLAIADTINKGLGEAGAAAEYTTNLELNAIIGNTISVILGLMGMVFVCILVYAGVLYVTSAGIDDNVKKAKKLITNSVIGIIIIIASYAIAQYLFAALTTITSSTAS